ncbi:hypothetical protein [Mesorhizobium sp. M0771]|uniref:hypothetical protein n=1 Tax=Mesorhizobium sp. M0771 TaxID=2956997 RepID=UPI00333AEE71
MATDVATRALKQALFDEYDGFFDKRIKKLDSGDFFLVDDRGGGDHDARKRLFLWFCSMTLRVTRGDAVELYLSGDVPKSNEVNALLDDMQTEGHYGRPTIVIEKGEQGVLMDLAQAFAAIVARGKRYPTPSYKYVCPRTAKSLVRLKNALDKAWR